jgi:hypothetical protein
MLQNGLQILAELKEPERLSDDKRVQRNAKDESLRF